MRDYFLTIADTLGGMLRGTERFTCAYSGESTDFVRFNRGRVRQAGHVVQRCISVDLIAGRRHATGTLTLSDNVDVDRTRLTDLVGDLRRIRAQVEDDPYLLYATEVNSGERSDLNLLPTGAEMMERLLMQADGHDLVGILASGVIHSGFANSFGQRNWHSRHSFNVDWSLYLHTDKAVKGRYAGYEWDDSALAKHILNSSGQLDALGRSTKTLAPGRYRSFLAPPAVDAIMGALAWGGFSMRDHRNGTSPLMRMVEQDVRMHPAVTITENTAEGVAPDFDPAGFIRPPSVTLIDGGSFRDCLVSARSAAEYQVSGTAATEDEAPLSIDVAPGGLPDKSVLTSLDCGLYIGNLWYLNYSDRNAARMTGMTRFATFWVEDGRIVAPVQVMRFDDSLYHLFGDRLVDLTVERQLFLDPETYGARSYRSARLPGILVDGMNLTL